MATIVKKENGKCFVVYRYTDENGTTKQKWESYPDLETAKMSKADFDSRLDEQRGN